MYLGQHSTGQFLMLLNTLDKLRPGKSGFCWLPENLGIQGSRDWCIHRSQWTFSSPFSRPFFFFFQILFFIFYEHCNSWLCADHGKDTKRNLDSSDQLNTNKNSTDKDTTMSSTLHQLSTMHRTYTTIYYNKCQNVFEMFHALLNPYKTDHQTYPTCLNKPMSRNKISPNSIIHAKPYTMLPR